VCNDELVSVHTTNKVPPFDEIAAVAISLSASDGPSTAGEDHEVPLLVVSTTTASHGDVEVVPVLTYQTMNAVLPDTGMVTGQELSWPAIPIAVELLHVLPAFRDTATYS